MRLVVGLGNPGEKYEDTRHNIGFVVVERLSATIHENGEWEESKKFKSQIYKPKNKELILIKPTTFMNQSGYAVKLVSNFYKVHPEEIYVIHDDLDIRFGEYKIQKGVGPKVHYGINSIEDKLESKYFWRVRVGVDNRDKIERVLGEEYVLQGFSMEEKKILEDMVKQLVEELLQRI